MPIMGCMSIQALSWCIKQDCDTPTTKLILFLLSNYADENNSCYPSEKHLGKLAGVSDRTVRRSLKWLSENNMVDIKPKLGTSNRYIVRVDSTVDTSDHPPRTSMTSNTKDYTKLYDHEFENWWNIYPRKVNKYQAKIKYRSARKKYAKDLLEKTTEFFSQVCTQQGTEERFIPHPSTWLNQKRFLDYEYENGTVKVRKKTNNSLNNIAG